MELIGPAGDGGGVVRASRYAGRRREPRLRRRVQEVRRPPWSERATSRRHGLARALVAAQGAPDCETRGDGGYRSLAFELHLTSTKDGIRLQEGNTPVVDLG